MRREELVIGGIEVTEVAREGLNRGRIACQMEEGGIL